MSIKDLTAKVSGKISRHLLVAQKNSPAGLVAVGIVGVTTTVVLACRATLKMSDILTKGEESLKNAENTDGEAEKTEKEISKKKFSVKVETGIKIAKLYAPAVIIGVASVGAITGSHVILSRRNAGLSAAYAIVDESFKKYRSRVVANHGKQKDFEYLHGVKDREIVEEGPNGPEVKTIRGLDAEEVRKGPSMYSRPFDEHNPNWVAYPSHQNSTFVKNVQNWANDKLIRDGFIFLNDVYDMLGYKKTSYGQVVGWVKGNGDNFVDFGVWNNGTFNGIEWIKGNEDGILLDFNVDGVVHDLLGS